MLTIPIPKPQPGEYAAYAIMYFDLVEKNKPIIQQLEDNLESTLALVKSMPDEKLSLPFAEGEWTVKEILVHNMDTERVLCYRALRFSRNDATELPGFEQDGYIAYANANDRSVDSLLEEYNSVRQATIAFFKNLPEVALVRSGISNGNPLSVRAAAWFIVGHELHHINSVRENYL